VENIGPTILPGPTISWNSPEFGPSEQFLPGGSTIYVCSTDTPQCSGNETECDTVNIIGPGISCTNDSQCN
jgi:hypothetical protein